MKTIDRRTFLQASAGAAVMAAASPGVFGSNDRIRAAVIGLRNRGHQVADSLLKTGRFDLPLFCDCDSAMFERGLSEMERKPEPIPTHVKDFRRVLDDNTIDAVVVATPDHWHALCAAMALDAGKHVYIEKPMTYNINEGKALKAASCNHPKNAVMVGTQQRSGAHFKEAADFVKSDGLGKVGFARAWITQKRPFLPIVPNTDPPETMDYDLWCGPAPLLPYNPELRHYNWHFTQAYGTGEMGNWGAHWIDVIRWFLELGLPLSVSGAGGSYVVHDAKETPDTQTVIYRFPELTVLWEQRIWTEHTIHGAGSAAEFVGEKGALVISRKGWTFFPNDGPPQEHKGSELDVAHANHFADVITGYSPPCAPVSEGHKSAVMCHLANISVRVGHELIFDPEQEMILNDPDAIALMSREYRAPWPSFPVL